MVTRYDVESAPRDVPCSLWAVEDANGQYVTYEDYETLRSKAAEVLREASAVYQLYNKTQEPDGNLVDMQTLQELADLL